MSVPPVTVGVMTDTDLQEELDWISRASTDALALKFPSLGVMTPDAREACAERLREIARGGNFEALVRAVIEYSDGLSDERRGA